MNVTILGAGNLGHHLAMALFNGGCTIQQIYNRTGASADHLAQSCGSQAVSSFPAILPSADLYIICVSDDAVASVAKKLSSFLPDRETVVHTAGNLPIDEVSRLFKNSGVFYPLQSFVKNRKPHWPDIPICIHTSNNATERKLKSLAHYINAQTHFLSDDERQKLHLPAVVVNNFVNYLFTLAKGYCQKEGLSFELLHALMMETVTRVCDGGEPKDMQTGPAFRDDNWTIGRHLKALEHYPETKETYAMMTRLISENYRK